MDLSCTWRCAGNGSPPSRYQRPSDGGPCELTLPGAPAGGARGVRVTSNARTCEVYSWGAGDGGSSYVCTLRGEAQGQAGAEEGHPLNVFVASYLPQAPLAAGEVLTLRLLSFKPHKDELRLHSIEWVRQPPGPVQQAQQQEGGPLEPLATAESSESSGGRAEAEAGGGGAGPAAEASSQGQQAQQATGGSQMDEVRQMLQQVVLQDPGEGPSDPKRSLLLALARSALSTAPCSGPSAPAPAPLQQQPAGAGAGARGTPPPWAAALMQAAISGAGAGAGTTAWGQPLQAGGGQAVPAPPMGSSNDVGTKAADVGAAAAPAAGAALPGGAGLAMQWLGGELARLEDRLVGRLESILAAMESRLLAGIQARGAAAEAGNSSEALDGVGSGGSTKEAVPAAAAAASDAGPTAAAAVLDGSSGGAAAAAAREQAVVQRLGALEGRVEGLERLAGELRALLLQLHGHCGLLASQSLPSNAAGAIS